MNISSMFWGPRPFLKIINRFGKFARIGSLDSDTQERVQKKQKAQEKTTCDDQVDVEAVETACDCCSGRGAAGAEAQDHYESQLTDVEAVETCCDCCSRRGAVGAEAEEDHVFSAFGEFPGP